MNNNENDVSNLQKRGSQLEVDLFGNVKKMILLIDPVSLGFGKGLPTNHFVSRSNDCRKNIRINRIFKRDKSRLNCEFVCTCVNGWPSIFLVTTEDVTKGDQLWSYYGARYARAIDDAKNDEKNKNERKDHIQTVIVKSRCLDKNQIEIYQLP